MEEETREIARGLRRHDPDLLDELIARYQYRLPRYLWTLTGSRESATSVRPTATNAHPSFKPPNNSFLGPFYPFGSYDT